MAKRQIIHVAQDAIRRNAKLKLNEPAIILRDGVEPSRHHGLQIHDAAGKLVGTFRYQPHEPLSCGARVWLELEPDFIATPLEA